MITPWAQQLQEVLKDMGKGKDLGRRRGAKRAPKGDAAEATKYEVTFPTCGKLTVSRYAFLCFTVSPEYPGRYKMSDNLLVSV